MNCENCPFEQRINALEKNLEKVTENNSSQHKEFYDGIHKSDVDTAIILSKIDQIQNNMNAFQSNLQKSIDTINKDILDLKEKPAKRWDTLITAFLTAIVSIFVTYMATKGGLR